MRRELLGKKMISPADLSLLSRTECPAEAVHIVLEHQELRDSSGGATTTDEADAG